MKTSADFLDDFSCDFTVTLTEAFSQRIDPRRKLGNIVAAQFRYIFTVDKKVEGLLVETVAVAFRASTTGEELSAPLARLIAGILVGHILDEFHHTVERTEEIRSRHGAVAQTRH